MLNQNEPLELPAEDDKPAPRKARKGGRTFTWGQAREYAISAIILGIVLAVYSAYQTETSKPPRLDDPEAVLKFRSDRDRLNVVFFLGLAVAMAGAVAASVAKSRDLSSKAVRLGHLPGKTRANVVSVLGPPQGVEWVGGFEHLTWSTRHYLITISFRDGVCSGLIREQTA